MGIYIGAVHVVNAIENRMREMHMTQAELAEKLGMKQPQLSKIISKSSMDTEKLSAFCLALEYNFFKLFCPEEEGAKINLNSIDLSSTSNNDIVISLIRMMEKEREEYRKELAGRDAQIKDKDALIKEFIIRQNLGSSFEKTEERMIASKA